MVIFLNRVMFTENSQGWGLKFRLSHQLFYASASRTHGYTYPRCSAGPGTVCVRERDRDRRRQTEGLRDTD